jgi:hypothetical protein
MDGPEFVGGVPVLKAAAALTAFHSIIDQTYLVVSGKERITRSDREGFKLAATRIETGSLQAAIEIIAPAAAIGHAVFQPYGGLGGIWDIAKNSFEFLKAFASLTHREQRPRVEAVAHEGARQLVVVGDNNQIIVDQRVFDTATRSEPYFESLARIVDGTHVNYISALDERDEGIVLSPEYNELLRPHAVVDEKPLTFVARVFRLDVRARTGRLRVLGAQPEGDYPFSIAGDQPLEPFAAALASQSASVRALRKIVVHPSGTETVSSYLVLEIRPLPG